MARLVGGMTTEDMRSYVEDLRYPILKHDAVHLLRHRGAPDALVGILENVPVTEFQSLEDLLASLPVLT